MRNEELEKKIKELEFKLKALQSFVHQHHHRLDVYKLGSSEHHETSKPKVWVATKEGWKEEP